MPWEAPGVGVGDSGWLGVALVVGWLGALALTGMIIKAWTERKHKK